MNEVRLGDVRGMYRDAGLCHETFLELDEDRLTRILKQQTHQDEKLFCYKCEMTAHMVTLALPQLLRVKKGE